MIRKLVMLCVIGASVVGAMLIDGAVKNRTTWHVFQIEVVPRFLTEEMAITFSRKALALEGFDVTEWEPQEDGRTVDPDGRTDKFVSRNSLNPNRVLMIFRHKADGRVRSVTLEIIDKADRVWNYHPEMTTVT